MDALLLLLRWMHILGVVVLVGGLCFSRFALLPALADTEEDSREKLQERIRRKWLPWVIIAITFLLVSGLTNFLLFNSSYFFSLSIRIGIQVVYTCLQRFQSLKRNRNYIK